MLKIKTYLDRSEIHGIGLFAGQDINKGSLIWEFNPHVDLAYNCQQWKAIRDSVTPQSFAALERYSYKEGNTYYLCLDNAQFMNHSLVGSNVVNRPDNTMVARCDICQGEELRCNYFEYSDFDDVHINALRHHEAQQAMVSE